MKRFSLLVLLCLAVWGVGKLWHLAKDGFSIARVQPFFWPDVCYQTALSSDLYPLSQSYTYLGRGHQCYAFLSADRKYVLKLPRQDHFDLPLWLRVFCHFPGFDSYAKSLRKDKERRQTFLYNSFALADRELKEQTALLAVHLVETQSVGKKVEIVDRIGRSFLLDLDKMPFILQERRDLMVPSLLHAVQRGELKRAQEILDSFLELIAIRARKKIFNKDPSFVRNFGLDGGQVVQIDVGSFYRKRDEEAPFVHSFRETANLVQPWLQKVHPELGGYFADCVEAILREER